MKFIRNIITAELLAELFILTVSIIIAAKAHANTVTVLAIVYGASFLSGIASLYTIRAAMRGNADQFPYGTGRLENACAFAYSLLLCSCASLALFKAGQRVFSDVVIDTRLGLSTIPIFLSFASNSIFLLFMKGHQKRTPASTPIADSYYLMYSTASLRDGITFATLLTGCFLFAKYAISASMIDGVISGMISLYVIGRAIPVAVTNFKALVDFPLPEEDRMKIIRVVVKYFAEYEALGRICNTRRGGLVVVEIELGFRDDYEIGQLDELRQRMQADLAEILPEFEFRIIPLRMRSMPAI